MRFFTQVLIVILLFSIDLAFGRIIRVPGNAANIQGGINAAERDDGDTVLVSAGFYPERINFGGKRVVLTSRFIYSRNWETVGETIIDGVWGGSVVTFSGAETNETVLMGFTIRHGRSGNGAGINCAGADPTLSSCLVTENLGNTSGGGIYCAGGEPILDNMRIIGNQSDGNGSGLYCSGTTITIINTVFSGNNAENQGGAIYFSGSSTADITKTLFLGNGADYGGAMLVAASHRDGINLDRVTLYGNGSNDDESGAMDIRDGYVNIVNCIIRNNGDYSMASSSGHPDDLIISYCNIEDGEDGIDISDRYYDWGEGNIDANPRFVDPREDDYHLMENSPCIDAGDPDSGPDPDGSRADMGRYYYHQSGTVWGYVLNAEDDSPVIGAVRMFNDFSERFANTNADGRWMIDGATIGDFSLTAFALGFNDSTLTELHLEADDELQADTIRLFHPTFEPTVEQLGLQLAPDSSGELEFTVANNGNGPLEWNVLKRV
ncbi:MAG: hypothetical protein P9M15_04545, partial [Candidatus Electryoneaceae bacterium]|nr:hypothetical protein [Candidatus Electryoneaceae bacterium]